MKNQPKKTKESRPKNVTVTSNVECKPFNINHFSQTTQTMLTQFTIKQLNTKNRLLEKKSKNTYRFGNLVHQLSYRGGFHFESLALAD